MSVATQTEARERSDSRDRDAKRNAAYEQGRSDALAGKPSTPPGVQYQVLPYDAGYEDGTTERAAGGTTTKAGKKPAGKGGKKAAAKKATSSRRPGGKRSSSSGRRRRSGPTRGAARKLAAPARRQVTSGMYVIGLALGVAVLFNLLENAQAVGKGLGWLANAVDWISDPSASIPYRTN